MKVITLIILAALTLAPLWAQETGPAMTATVIRTKHNAAITDDVTATGTFTFDPPGKMSILFEPDIDLLLMDGDTFTVITDGKVSTAKGRQADQLQILQKVLVGILTDSDGDIDNLHSKDMQITRESHSIHITPLAPNGKAQRRMMFTSFTLTVDPVTSALRSMCMHEKAGNYTLYEFPAFERNH